jgi:hypothetical protein
MMNKVLQYNNYNKNYFMKGMFLEKCDISYAK